jgi:hypothetical protein
MNPARSFAGLRRRIAPSLKVLHRRLEKHARFGYSFGGEMTDILKRKAFARWQSGECLPDAALCKAVQEMESGLIDADLGGSLYKKRVARPGGGKSGGYRTLVSARIGSRYVFLHGFPKSDKANISQNEKKALQFAGRVFLELSEDALSKALQSGVLMEVHCEQDH